MNINDYRTSHKPMTVAQVLSVIEDPLDDADYCEGLDFIIWGYHPLPHICLKHLGSNEYSCVGERTRDILYTLKSLMVGLGAEDPAYRRKIQGYNLEAIIFEDCVGQDELIKMLLERHIIR